MSFQDECRLEFGACGLLFRIDGDELLLLLLLSDVIIVESSTSGINVSPKDSLLILSRGKGYCKRLPCVKVPFDNMKLTGKVRLELPKFLHHHGCIVWRVELMQISDRE
jgi:hypothetical protein